MFILFWTLFISDFILVDKREHKICIKFGKQVQQTVSKLYYKR